LSEHQGIDVVFCDDTRLVNVPKETPEQAAVWAKERKKLTEKYSSLLEKTA